MTANHLSYNLPPRAIEETSSAAKVTCEKTKIDTATKILITFFILLFPSADFSTTYVKLINFQILAFIDK